MNKPTQPTFKYKGTQYILKSRSDRPMEVDTGFLNEDGFKRNLLKFKVELAWAKFYADRAKAGHGGPLTAILNRWVEKFRRAPYTYAHFAFYGVGVLIVAGLAALAKWG